MSYSPPSPPIEAVKPPPTEGEYLGLPQDWVTVVDATAEREDKPEGTAHFHLTTGVGGSDITAHHKTALSSSITIGPNSASGWTQASVCTLLQGGQRKGGIVFEFDLNNFWGDFPSSTANPYAANIYCTGMNWDGQSGGISDAAIIIAFNQNERPMWEDGILFQGANAFRNAAFCDLTRSPISVQIADAHVIGIDMSSGSFALAAIQSPGFKVDGQGNTEVRSLRVNGRPVTVDPNGFLRVA